MPEDERSFGTMQAVERMEELMSGDGHGIDTVLINLATLLRNRYSRDLSPEQLLNEVQEDYDTVVQRLTPLLAGNSQADTPAALIFYTSDYRQAIPRKFLRSIPPSKIRYNNTWARMLNRMSDQSGITNGVRVVQSRLRVQRRIYRSLEDVIRQYATGGSILMTTHINCDYHIALRYDNFRLVESFTGEVIRPKGFSVKAFGNEHVPFYPCTHAVLGDKELISPTWTRDEKKQLFREAEENNWKLRPQAAVRSIMYKRRWLDPRMTYPLL